jgi:hypothetical protein
MYNPYFLKKNDNQCWFEQLQKMPLLLIVSGTGTAIWSKTDFGPTGHHHPHLVTFAAFPAILPLFK